MRRYRVRMHTKPAMCRTYYEGKVDVEADSADAAIETAIWRASRVHGHKDFVVESVEIRK